MRTRIRHRRAIAPPPNRSFGDDRAAMLQPPQLGRLPGPRARWLGRVKEGVIGAEPERAARLPAKLRLHAPAITRPAAVGRAGQEAHRVESIDDFVVEALPVASQRSRELVLAIAQG